MFDYEKYLEFIKYQDVGITKFIYDLFVENKNDNIENATLYPIDSQKAFISNLWLLCEKVNSGLNGSYIELANNLLFTHELVLNSKIINPSIFSSYDVETHFENLGYQYTSIGDSSTSVGLNISDALKTQSLQNQRLMMTKWGLQYMLLLQEINQMIVVL